MGIFQLQGIRKTEPSPASLVQSGNTFQQQLMLKFYHKKVVEMPLCLCIVPTRCWPSDSLLHNTTCFLYYVYDDVLLMNEASEKLELYQLVWYSQLTFKMIKYIIL